MLFLFCYFALIYFFYKSGCSPLYYAAKSGQNSAVEFLIANQANINLKDSVCDCCGMRPCVCWCAYVVRGVCTWGACACAYVLLTTFKFNRSPVHAAASNGHDVCVQLLVDAGADINTEDNVQNMRSCFYVFA